MSSPLQLNSIFGNFGNTSGNTIWNHNGEGYSGYEVDSASEMSNTLIDSFLDPTGLVSGFWNDITGTTSQSREFAQQEYLQDKMNEYNTPANQMARMKAAGINPNTAAAGIAQSGSESAQAPAVASNTGGAAAGLSAVGSALGGVSGAALTAAQKRNLDASSTEMMANATRTNSLLQYEQGKLEAETSKLWVDKGMDEHMANYWSAKAAYADQQEYLDVQGKLWAISKCSNEIDLLKQEVDLKKQDINLRKGQVSEQEYKNDILEIDKYFAEERKKIYQSAGIDVNQSELGMLVEAYENGHSDLILNGFKKANYAKTQGQLMAEIDQAFYKLEKDKDFIKALEDLTARDDLTPMERLRGMYTVIYQFLPKVLFSPMNIGK